MKYGYDYTENVDIDELVRLWDTTYSLLDIQIKLGIDVKKLRHLIKKHKIPKRRPFNDRADHGERTDKDPTEKEIAQMTEEIRSSWSDQEYERRAAVKLSRNWQAPEYTYEIGTRSFTH